jgi:hypothetical protein
MEKKPPQQNPRGGFSSPQSSGANLLPLEQDITQGKEQDRDGNQAGELRPDN